MRLHIDTDLGGTPDDACAVVMVLGLQDVDLVGITTTADEHGRRAEQVRELLSMLGVGEVPVAAGSDEDRAAELLTASVEAGAAVAAIGPYTNVARLEAARPGALDGASVFTMGGWVDPPPAGFPDWGPARDRNVQSDVAAARSLFESGAELTFVPCAAAATALVRTTDLPRLSASGPVGDLLARQTMLHAEQHGYAELARRHAALGDLVGFLWDPVTCAVATGWPGASFESMSLRPVLEEGLLRFERHPRGRRTAVVCSVDGPALSDMWLSAVERAQRALADPANG